MKEDKRDERERERGRKEGRKQEGMHRQIKHAGTRTHIRTHDEERRGREGSHVAAVEKP